MQITFIVPGLPVAQPRQRTRIVAAGGRVFGQNYLPKTDPVNAFKAAVRLAAQAAYSGPPLTVPLAVSFRFYFPRPKAMTWKKREMPRAPKPGKPDLDNLFKSCADALTGLLFTDDALIASARVDKWIAAGDEQPRTVITVEEIESTAPAPVHSPPVACPLEDGR